MGGLVALGFFPVGLVALFCRGTQSILRLSFLSAELPDCQSFLD